MIIPRYAPGTWQAVVTDGHVCLLPAEVDADTVAALWTAVREGAGLTAQLQLLLAGGLDALPPFALVALERDRVHVVVRGDVEVDVEGADPRTVRGRRVATWHEDVVDGARAVQVRVLGTATAVTGADARLPVLSAVVRADVVAVDLRPAATGREEAPSQGSAAQGATAAQGAPARPVPRPEPGPEPTAPGAPPVPAGTAGLDDLEHTVLHAQTDTAVDLDLGAVRAAPAEPDAPVAPAAPAPPDVPDVSDVPAAPAAPAPPDETDVSDVPAAPDDAADDADHDGTTVLSSDVVALRRQLPDWAGEGIPGPLAVPAADRPAPAKIRLSSGLVVALTRPVLLGRAPQVSRVSNREMPRLVTVASPRQDISRTHAEVRMDGDDVLVTDLRSTNGVLLLRQGQGPQRLHPGEPTVVEPGVSVDLGEGVTFVVERGA